MQHNGMGGGGGRVLKITGRIVQLLHRVVQILLAGATRPFFWREIIQFSPIPRT